MKEEIQTVAIIGLGAVGINFAQLLQKHMPNENLWIVADDERIKRYQQEGIYYNEERCEFHYVHASQQTKAVDLILFSTKFMGLQDAITTALPIIDEHTIIMSLINGISSEEVLAKTFHKDQIIYTVAQGMDATKVGNHVTCSNIGELCFGDAMEGKQKHLIEQVSAFFTQTKFPYSVKDDILHHQWGKFMLNVGLNQVVAIHHGTYDTIQKEGEARHQMLAAMQEVKELSILEGIHLTQEEVKEWAALCDGLSPIGKPSMAQDVDAHRKTEVALFASEVIKRAKQYGLRTPVNEFLEQELHRIENSYERIYYYHCGVMDAFAEIVGAGVKQMALSHPFESVEEMKQYLPYARELCQRYKIQCYEEPSLLITDLFPISMNKGKCNIIFVKEETIWHSYCALKEKKQALRNHQAYKGQERTKLAISFGALLSYTEEACIQKINANHEKELV